LADPKKLDGANIVRAAENCKDFLAAGASRRQETKKGGAPKPRPFPFNFRVAL